MKVTDACIACGTCADSCEVGAINESEDCYIINERCTACGACVSICPVDAIVE